MIIKFKGIEPTIDKTAFVMESADIIGKVTLKKDSNIWSNVTLRADYAEIVIGEESNVQDNSCIHVEPNNPCIVGRGVTVGHGVILHACTIGDNSLIGMGATVLDEVVIGKNSIVGANSLVTKGKVFEDNSLIVGSPAKCVKKLTDEQVESIRENKEEYLKLVKEYRD